MPSFASTTTIRDGTDGFHLTLTARHVLVVGEPSDTVYDVRGRVSHDVDVTLQSDLVVSLSGMINRVAVNAQALQTSAVALHMQNYIHMARRLLMLLIHSY